MDRRERAFQYAKAYYLTDRESDYYDAVELVLGSDYMLEAETAFEAIDQYCGTFM